jgi:hypothetical protein
LIKIELSKTRTYLLKIKSFKSDILNFLLNLISIRPSHQTIRSNLILKNDIYVLVIIIIYYFYDIIISVVVVHCYKALSARPNMHDLFLNHHVSLSSHKSTEFNSLFLLIRTNKRIYHTSTPSLVIIPYTSRFLLYYNSRLFLLFDLHKKVA